MKHGTAEHDSTVTSIDAWNRMVAVKDSGGGLMETMAYTASGMRGSAVDVDLCGGNTVSQNYYSVDWQVLQKTDTIPYCCGYTTSTSTYVWGLTYVNDLVARDKDGTRTYVQQDANHNVTALVNTSGAVTLRFIYDSYGAATVLTANWGASASPMFDIGYQGGRFDPNSGLYNFQRRDYSVSLGRWMQVDPWGYVDGMSLYQFVRSGPVRHVDPSGLLTEKMAKDIILNAFRIYSASKALPDNKKESTAAELMRQLETAEAASAAGNLGKDILLAPLKAITGLSGVGVLAKLSGAALEQLIDTALDGTEISDQAILDRLGGILDSILPGELTQIREAVTNVAGSFLSEKISATKMVTLEKKSKIGGEGYSITGVFFVQAKTANRGILWGERYSDWQFTGAIAFKCIPGRITRELEMGTSGTVRVAFTGTNDEKKRPAVEITDHRIW